MMFKLFQRRSNKALIDQLHGDIVALVRQPALYSRLGAIDTFEGRFELLVLFTSVVTRRLESLQPHGPSLSQDVIDAVFSHLDIAMREIGISDVAMPKKMKKLAGDFAGRSRAYGEALQAQDKPRMAEAILRNIYAGRADATSHQAEALSNYTFEVDAALAALTMDSVLAKPLALPLAEASVDAHPALSGHTHSGGTP